MAKLTIGPHYWNKLRLVQLDVILALQRGYDVRINPKKGREPWPENPDVAYMTRPNPNRISAAFRSRLR